jgi:hypothetical protein
MGLFDKKKRDVSNLPELPKFEDVVRDAEPITGGIDKLPTIDGDVEVPRGEGVPAYESAFSGSETPKEKVEIKKPVFEPEIPERKPMFFEDESSYGQRRKEDDFDEAVIPRMGKENEEFPIARREDINSGSFPQQERVEQPFVPQREEVMKKEIQIPKKVEEKPVFVQIDDYRDAMNNIEILKQKVREVEYVLDKLNDIKSQEQIEISNCETSLNKIKEKLIEVDKKLFEI